MSHSLRVVAGAVSPGSRWTGAPATDGGFTFWNGAAVTLRHLDARFAGFRPGTCDGPFAVRSAVSPGDVPVAYVRRGDFRGSLKAQSRTVANVLSTTGRRLCLPV